MPRELPGTRGDGVELRRGDVRDANAVARACEGCDVVFHTAAIAGIWGPKSEYFAVNTRGTAHVIAGCQLAGVSKLVHTSSPSVIYDGVGPSGVDHEGADESLPYPFPVFVRLSGVQGSGRATGAGSQRATRPGDMRAAAASDLGAARQPFVSAIDRPREERPSSSVGSGTNRISTVHVETAAAAHLQAADGLAIGSAVAGNAYFVNDPRPVEMWPWIDRILGLAGLPPVKKAHRLGGSVSTGGDSGGSLSGVWISRGTSHDRFLALQMGTSHFYSTARAERDFGFHPVVDPDAALDAMAAELKGIARRA